MENNEKSKTHTFEGAGEVAKQYIKKFVLPKHNSKVITIWHKHDRTHSTGVEPLDSNKYDRCAVPAEQVETYVQLLTAVQDLLCELRIDPTGLKIMAQGTSPDYPGAAPPSWESTHCKVQLSQVLAQKLVDAAIFTDDKK